MIEQDPGDFVIKVQGRVALRFHFTDDALEITKYADTYNHVTICHISEAIELGTWLDHKINEPR